MHGGGEAEVLVFVGLVHKYGVNAHIVKVLHIVNLAVEHFQCANLGVLTSGGLALLIAFLLLALHGFGQFGKSRFLLGKFPFGLANNQTATV